MTGEFLLCPECTQAVLSRHTERSGSTSMRHWSRCLSAVCRHWRWLCPWQQHKIAGNKPLGTTRAQPRAQWQRQGPLMHCSTQASASAIASVPTNDCRCMVGCWHQAPPGCLCSPVMLCHACAGPGPHPGALVKSQSTPQRAYAARSLHGQRGRRGCLQGAWPAQASSTSGLPLHSDCTPPCMGRGSHADACLGGPGAAAWAVFLGLRPLAGGTASAAIIHIKAASSQ